MALPRSRAGHAGITVLPCSREIRDTVGPLAWVVLEELALRTQGSGDPAIDTNVRALASDLGVGKDTIAQALSRLITLGLVRCQPQRRAGRYAGSTYEIDLVACRHVGLVADSPAVDQHSVAAPPCPIQPDPVQGDATATDTVAAARDEFMTRATAPPTPLRETISQSLFDLPGESSLSLFGSTSEASGCTKNATRATTRTDSTTRTGTTAEAPPTHPVPTIPEPDPSLLLTRSNEGDALAPEVRRGPVNVAGDEAGKRSALNGNLNGEATGPC